MTTFSALLQTVRPDGDAFAAEASDDWHQGRTLYGGGAAALCLEACLRVGGALPPLRSAQISFIGPAVADLRLTPVVLRQGKSATFMGCVLTSEGQIATRAVFCFGAARDSAYARLAARAPAITGPDGLPDYFPAERRPAFAHHEGGEPRDGVGANKKPPPSVASPSERRERLHGAPRPTGSDAVKNLEFQGSRLPASGLRPCNRADLRSIQPADKGDAS